LKILPEADGVKAMVDAVCRGVFLVAVNAHRSLVPWRVLQNRDYPLQNHSQ
jgi:hypothetical protein